MKSTNFFNTEIVYHNNIYASYNIATSVIINNKNSRRKKGTTSLDSEEIQC